MHIHNAHEHTVTLYADMMRRQEELNRLENGN